MRAAVAVLVVLGACGNDRAAHVDDASADAASTLLTFSSCHIAPLECADLVVPIDYANPSAGTLTLPVVRAPARDPAHRIGVLAFNFGGPGEATLEPIEMAWPHQPIDSATDLTQRFDFIGIDWRGVATSEPALSCLDATTAAALATEEFAPGSDADWAALFQLVGELGSGCRAQTSAALLAHVDAADAARDFDALRAGLGEDKLNLWVVSYGTRLGEMYAELFPDRVRAVVLDSPVPPVPDFESYLQAQSVAFENELQRFFAWCAGTTSAVCPFRTADGSASSVAAAYEALLAQADTAPQVVDGLKLDRPTIDTAVLGELYFPSNQWPMLGQQLAALGSGSGGPLAAAGAGIYDYSGDDNAFSALLDIFALDFPLPAALATGSAYEAWSETQGSAAPHFGLQDAASTAFVLALPTAMPADPPIAATTAPPLLVTATRNDPATPYADAPAVVAAFANGSYLVTYEGDGHANGEFQSCLGDVTAAFLIDPTTPPQTADCADVAPTARPAPLPAFAPRRRRR